MGAAQSNVLYIFINHTFCDINEDIKLAQILINSHGSFKVVSKIVSIGEVREIYEKSKSNNNIKVDFSFEGPYLRCDDVPMTKLEDSGLAQIRGVVSENQPVLISIYDLFSDIVNNGGYLISDEVIDNEPELFVEGMSEFIPKFSQSTMTCYIPIKVKGQWKSKKLIYVEDGKLVSSDFYFLIRASCKNNIEKYNIQSYREVTYRNEPFILYKYQKELSIYSYSAENLVLLPSIVNRYCYLSEMYKSIIDTLDFLSKTMCKELYGEEPEVNTSKKSSDYNSKYVNGYATFTLEGPKVRRARRNFFITDICNTVIPGLQDGSMTTAKFREHIQILNLNYMERAIYKALMDVLVNKGGTLPLDRIAYIRMTSSKYKKLKFTVDTYLYMLRASLFSFDSTFSKFSLKRLRGSDVPYTTLLERRVAY